MKVETNKSATLYTGLYTDEGGFTWNLLQREGGSVSLYGTRRGSRERFVVFDTNNVPVNANTVDVINRINEIAGNFQAVVRLLREIKS